MKQMLAVLAVVTLAGCSKSSPAPTSPGGTQNPPASTADVVIDIKGQLGAQSYAPSPTTVRVGQSVAWRNADTTAHNATQDGGAFASTTLDPGQTSSARVMSTAGAFTYHCTIHPGMTGTLTVQ